MTSTPQNVVIDNTTPAQNLRNRPKRTPKYSKYAASVASPTTSSSSITTTTSTISTTTTSQMAPATTAPKRKPNIKIEERNLPEKITSFIPESHLYTSLLEFEKKLDYALVRRHLEVQEVVQGRGFQQRPKKIIRINIFNTYNNQSGIYHTDNKTLVM